jgi:hypothetical protein
VTAGRSGIHSGTAPPSPAHVGQRWFNTATAVTYQYTRDAAGTKFWLDISSGGIGTSAERGVDFVGDTDPHLETNGSGLAVGSIYYNREADRYFKCTTATTNANVWAGRFAGSGGIEGTYKSGSDFFRSHTYLSSGTFVVDGTITTVDYLVVGGGGGGGGRLHTNYAWGGGGGAGGMRTVTSQTLTNGTYTVTVGQGGPDSTNGEDTVFNGTTVLGGGAGGLYGSNGSSGGSGGGAGGDGPNITGGGSSAYGNNGGNGKDLAPEGAGGGGGAGAVGNAGIDTSTGAGGVGATNDYRTGSNIYYAGGGGGSLGRPDTGGDYTTQVGGNGGGGAGGQGGSGGNQQYDGVDGTPNTGGGGGGGGYGHGGSGIVVIRYQLNA